MRDFQPVAFSNLILPLISPALTSRTETHATLSSHSSPKTGIQVFQSRKSGSDSRKNSAFF